MAGGFDLHAEPQPMLKEDMNIKHVTIRNTDFRDATLSPFTRFDRVKFHNVRFSDEQLGAGILNEESMASYREDLGRPPADVDDRDKACSDAWRKKISKWQTGLVVASSSMQPGQRASVCE